MVLTLTPVSGFSETRRLHSDFRVGRQPLPLLRQAEARLPPRSPGELLHDDLSRAVDRTRGHGLEVRLHGLRVQGVQGASRSRI
jgi:hypothetical protein